MLPGASSAVGPGSTSKLPKLPKATAPPTNQTTLVSATANTATAKEPTNSASQEAVGEAPKQDGTAANSSNRFSFEGTDGRRTPSLMLRAADKAHATTATVSEITERASEQHDTPTVSTGADIPMANDPDGGASNPSIYPQEQSPEAERLNTDHVAPIVEYVSAAEFFERLTQGDMNNVDNAPVRMGDGHGNHIGHDPMYMHPMSETNSVATGNNNSEGATDANAGAGTGVTGQDPTGRQVLEASLDADEVVPDDVRVLSWFDGTGQGQSSWK